jgi:type I restriction enzyme S subunit
MANVSSSNGLEKRPKLRFPGFDEPWEHKELLYYLVENTDRNKQLKFGKENVLSVSGEYGIVNQIAFQGRSFAGESVADYHVVETDDIVYTKSPLKANPYGIIKVNNGVPGIVSTLYAVYHPLKTVVPRFVDFYFSNDLRLNKFLKPLVNIGAKHDMKVNNTFVLTGMVVFPPLREQQKIVDFLTILDRRIDVQRKKVEALKKYKRGLLNQIFSAISKGSQRRKLRELVHVSGGKTPSMSNSLYWNGDIVWISSKDMKSSRISGSELKITNLALNEMTLYHPGTLLLVARSGILKHSLPLAILEVDATINQDIKALQVHGCNAFYLYYAILSQEDNIIRTLVKTGTTVQSLMMDSFLNIEIPTPNIDQQQSIIDKLAKLEKYVDVQGKELSLLSQMRNGLLQQLFI